MDKLKQDQEKKDLFNCTYVNCEWKFDCNYKLQRHIRSHTGEKPFACQLCQTMFTTQYNLKSHLKIHNRIKCKYKGCKEIFDNVANCTKHFNDDHVDSYKCSKKRCMLVFQTQNELQEHLDNHNLLYPCIEFGCGKRFKKPSLLKQHALIHSGDLPFKCTFVDCSKAFTTQQRLSRHCLIHENKKSFLCDVEGCRKSFNQADYLKTHMRTHEILKGYACPLESCQRMFVSAETLKVHMQRHENIRPFKCDQVGCDKSYLTAGNLKSHLKAHLSGRKMRKRRVTLANDDDVVTSNTICVNEFINAQIYETSVLTDSTIESDQTLSKDLLAARFGEFVCNQYINTDDQEQIPILSGEETAVTLSQSISESMNENDGLTITDIDDIQFQEEFVTSIYAPSINNLGLFDSGHDYEQSGMVSAEKSETVFLTPVISELNKLDNDTRIIGNDVESFESSMELSTGHLVIDGCYFGASSCMPDHIYSHRNKESSKSTVNLQDIR